MIYQNILQTIGNTPLVRLAKIVPDAEVYAKVESFNPGGSVKDRIALSMIEDAEQIGLLKQGDVIVEPTSGNTGIGLAMVAAYKGYKTRFTMPETMSIERRKLLKLFGAEIILTPASEGMAGSIAKAEELASSPHHFMPQQFNNPANPAAHVRTTAPEIISGLDGKVPDCFVAGVGTGGTISGVGKLLKQAFPNIRIIAVEPEDSSVLSGGKPGTHKIQGIGAGFIPAVYNPKVVDEIVKVSNRDAIATARRLASEEGILAGISSGASLHAAIRFAQKGKIIVVLLPDTGERYMSTELFEVE